MSECIDPFCDECLSSAPTPCEQCGKPADSFACKIRHINVDTSWAKGDH